MLHGTQIWLDSSAQGVKVAIGIATARNMARSWIIKLSFQAYYSILYATVKHKHILWNIPRWLCTALCIALTRDKRPTRC